MHRAIAARRRVCQAAALALVLSPLRSAAQDRAPAIDFRSATARTPEGVLVREWCSALDARLAANYPCGTLAREAAEVLHGLTPLLGPFPHEGLTLQLRQFPLSSPVVFVSSGPAKIRLNAAAFKSIAGSLQYPDLIARELARQWFLPAAAHSRIAGRLVGEGLPEYLAWRYLRETHPGAARALVEEAMRDMGAGSAAAADGDTGALHYAVGGAAALADRQRGLLILRTLETVIDRERVDRVLPELVRRSARHSLTLAAFQKVCEEIAGRDLGWFFRYFFDQRGIPEIELRRLPSESPGVVAGEILVRGLPLDGSVRVEMTVRTAQGSVKHSVATRGGVTPFTVNVPAPAIEIILDPDQRILRWTEAARRSRAQSQILAVLPNPLTRKNLADAITLYRRALEADPADASLRAQALRERLGELEWAHDEWNAALTDLDSAINGHSIAPFETFLTRGKAYLHHGVVSLHERRPQDALEDARAGLALPSPVLLASVPREPIDSRGAASLEQLLLDLQHSASRAQ